MSEPQKSAGHVCFVGDHEYVERDGDLHRSSLSNVLGVDGVRMGMRWQCSMSRAAEFFELLRRSMDADGE